jgi:CRISPR/Cas system-associated exonuclease Cas4 (RecB family)
VLTASEIAEFIYCPQSWWLRRQGVVGAAIGELRRRQRTEFHGAIGHRTDSLRASRAGSRLLRAAAIVLALVAALIASVLLSPRVWAAGLNGTGVGEPASGVPAIAVLIGASAVTWLFSSWLGRRADDLQHEIGLDKHERVLAADNSRLSAPTLTARGLGLVARPDHLVRLADGTTIPVEHKPRARRVYRSHVIELGAQLMVVEACSGQRPPYGVLVVSGERHEVLFDMRLERAVLGSMQAMRALLARGIAPGPRWLGAKCRACEFYEPCWIDTHQPLPGVPRSACR